MAKKMSKKLKKKLERTRHHKGRAGHSRHPPYFNDAATIQELRREFSVYQENDEFRQ